MNLRTITAVSARPFRRPSGAPRPPVGPRSPAVYLAVAAAGAVMVNVLAANEPAAQADAELAPVSIAEQLGVSPESSAPLVVTEDLAPLEQLAVSRSARDADQTAAAQAQIAADQAELDARAAQAAAQAAAEAAAAEAARLAAEEAARVEAARAAEVEAAAARPGQGTAAPVAPAGSYQEYAMGKLGGSGGEFNCLESLWGKESGWNPNAQNPRSTAYGIAQFLDSTWAGTGIGKTSDGYRQIDAGLIYIENRFGSPCGAWSHSQSKGWY